MNFRITTCFFALLLTMLWVFGLMIAHRKSEGNQGAILSSLKDAKIDKIVFKKSEKSAELPPIVFERDQKDDAWYLHEDGRKTKVQGFQIKKIIDEIKDAKPEDADLTKDPAFYGMNAPELVVTLKGTLDDKPTDWTFTIGKGSPDKSALLYVGSSDQPGKVFAVSKKNLESLFIENPHFLRSKRLFDFSESAVTDLSVKEAGKEAKQLDLKRNDNGLWVFVKPALGFAGFESAEPDDKKKGPKETGGVKGLLASIATVRVEEDTDFVSLSKPPAAYGLESGKEETLRLEIRAREPQKKEETKEVLLVGKKVRDHKGPDEFYYARLDGDEGVFQLNAKYLDPIEVAVKDPGKLRSLDVAAFDPKNVDAVVIKQGKDEVKLLLPEKRDIPEHKFMPPAEPNWLMIVGSDKKTEKEKANDKAVQALIEQVLGKNAIVKFHDEASEAERKKQEVEWGLNPPVAEIAVYVNAFEKEKKDEPKDEKEKKDEKKDEIPTMKKDAKPAITLAIGKSDKEFVQVKRTLQDGTTVSYFTMKKEFADKVAPPEGVALAYRSLELPSFPNDEVVALKLTRTTDKGTETLDLERRETDGKANWYVKDPLEPTGAKLADSQSVAGLISAFGGASRPEGRFGAKKWLKKIDDKTDLDKYGLKNPGAIVAITTKKPVSASGAASLLGALGDNTSLLAAASGVFANRQADTGETITIALGKDTDQEKDKPGTFATHSGVKMLFLVQPDVIKILKDIELRDRAGSLNVQGRLIASYLAIAALDPIGLLMLDSPHISGQVLDFDPDKVKGLKLAIRTPIELRSFDFEKNLKDKTWSDKSNLLEFQLDGDKVTQLLKDLAKLKTDRFVAYATGPRGEHKLGAKDATIKLDLTMDDGKIVTINIGASYQAHGYFANISTWPEAVFFVPSATVEPLLRGVGYFSKDRSPAQ